MQPASFRGCYLSRCDRRPAVGNMGFPLHYDDGLTSRQSRQRLDFFNIKFAVSLRTKSA